MTFRLADSLPGKLRSEWEPILRIKDDKTKSTRIEAYLDRGLGACHLKVPAVAQLVQEAMLKFDGDRYRLFGWCVMPNHVHALLEITSRPLKEILHTWKAFSALGANRLLERKGTFWQGEYFDRFMRDLEHFKKTLRYIEANPVKAGLCETPEDWPWSSAKMAVSSSDRSAGVQPAKHLEGLRWKGGRR